MGSTPRRKTRADLIHYLHDHIVGALHVGQVRPGDRLPSIRDLAAQFGMNTRTVKAAYDALEKERLVEVRGRSGVFVAPQQIPGGETSEEVARWMSDVVAGAWKRRIPVGTLGPFVSRFTASRRICCGLVEVLEDAIVALGYELEMDWGFEVRVVAPADVENANDVDFFAATSFHASSIHDVVERLGKPLVVLTIHPGLQEAIRRRIRQGVLTVIAADKRFTERMRLAYSPDHPERVRFVLASDRSAVEELDPNEPVLLTRAAGRRTGSVRAPMIFPHSPTLSPETAQALANIVVRKNAETF
ncbi:MAG: winged helix-turn-helix domain-containing protein [Gemmatimonadota bacterium]